MKTGVRRWIRDKGGVSSSELSAIVDKLADPASKTGLPEVRHIARPSGATFAVSGSWNDDSAFMLTNPQSVDTTDRSLVDRARNPSNVSFKSSARPPDLGAAGRFDGEGFGDDRGLMREMFYWSPFMTCAACNTLAVFDSAAARAFGAVLHKAVHPDAAAECHPEPLPRCETCGSTADWWDGSHNLLQLLGANKAELAAKRAREKMATTKIQGAYRAYLRRRWGRAETQRHIIYAMRRYRAATLVQTLLRGRLGRRRAVTFCAVRIIAWSHPSLLALAVKGERHHRRRVFWYKKDQLKMVYKDYLEVKPTITQTRDLQPEFGCTSCSPLPPQANPANHQPSQTNKPNQPRIVPHPVTTPFQPRRTTPF